jgi:hypothetical protein
LSEFVVFYRETVKSSPTSILCTSYNIERVDQSSQSKFGDFKVDKPEVGESRFGCRANFTRDVCNKTVVISLEAWTVTRQLLQPTSKPVLIECDADADASDADFDANNGLIEADNDDNRADIDDIEKLTEVTLVVGHLD